MSVKLNGSCFCRKFTYRLLLNTIDEARGALCHCVNCKKAYGGNYGLTAKVPWSSFHCEQGDFKAFRADNGMMRKFCPDCGTFIVEYPERDEGSYYYVMIGTLDNPSLIKPALEIFCKDRLAWMPPIADTTQKDASTD